ncbi:crossover junction endodeoxyribonuclease RuvC [candidate division WOR-3 bacterium]|nr:crossover junction endodeoxyribonuclease RuvC [candidate division WOR-3 bacterium]
MKIIGIDAGLRHTGYAIMEDTPHINYVRGGTLDTTDKIPLPKRLKKLYQGMKEIMQKESPDVAIYESVFYKQNLKIFSHLAQARGVLLLAAEELGIKIKEYTPAEIKQAITGNGRASKHQVHGMVERLLKTKIPSSSDIGDAIACALCYFFKRHKSNNEYNRR